MKKNDVYNHLGIAHLRVLAYRLVIIYVLYFLSRILFFVFNHSYFSALGFGEFLKIVFIGLRFDVSAIMVLNSVFIVLSLLPFTFREHKKYQLFLKIFFLLINSIAYFAICADFVYFRFTLKHTTADIFDLLFLGNDTLTLLPQFLRDFWYVFLIWLIYMSLTVFCWNKIKIKKTTFPFSWKRTWIQTLVLIIGIFIGIIGARGGFQLKPISIITAGKYTSPENVPLLLNTPFTIINTFSQKGIKEITFYKDKKLLENEFNPVIQFRKTASLEKKNVVIIILESFSWEYIGSLNPSLDQGKYKGYTPFLDSLISKSSLIRCYANGKRSIEGIPAILSGLPSLMNEPYITSLYSGNKINSFASLLKTEGYNSSFFHGGTNGTMGFDAFVKMAGFEAYYGRSEYNNEGDYDGKWGIYDEPFLQYFAKQLNGFSQPFITSVFTLSSHHPYHVPSALTAKFPKGTLDIHQSIAYTDYSLMKFFETASKMPWFSNTIFVLTADHTSEAYFDFFKSKLGMYQIPLLFYAPKNDLPPLMAKVSQQCDILPSVLDLIHFDKPFIAYGKSVFDSTYKGFSVSYMNDAYQLIQKEYLLQFDGQRTTGFFNIQKDSTLQINLASTKLKQLDEMESFIKAYIQQYQNRMIKNQQTID